MRNFFIFVFEVVKVVVISLAIIIPVRYFLIQPFYVKGASMEPSFYDHEYLIVDEMSYRFRLPERGEIVVFKYPLDPSQYFIKRVIGLPGEKVEIKDGSVYIYTADTNRQVKIDEPYLGSGVDTLSANEDVVELGPDQYYLLGDNRNHSKDSRSFGQVKESFIVGRVVFRGWPFNRLGTFSLPEYSLIGNN
ncbi:signal peptidase I [Candidatus Falkowbacteria bacterium RIFOXYC2_FULL_47_12]|uniref:Signal peptidase I n=2 Tax=Candidatus Falkowiibacteriota TaxID=1752728 RepID=A0A1F5TPS8_9BACT|nr:MAG: signal peptidase I [Candidatus Falkowbacteria bacterium RIFOXYA2_FULL_47_9]OGF40848.1 MAG: signal peptidase I [Candidatus Falkowbacteria bacterium RIFOXYC2_FULL_47_12]